MQRLQNLITGDNLRARLIRAGFGSAGIQAADRVLALALGIVLARMLGAEGYGVYAYAFAIMTLLMVLAEAGVPMLLMREIAASHGREEWGLLRGVVRRAGQFVTLAAGTVAIIGLLILFAIGDTLSTEVFYTTGLMLLVLPLSAGTKTITHALFGLRHVVLGQALNMLLRPLLVLGLVVTLFLLWPELRHPQSAMAAQLVSASVVLTAVVMILRHVTPDAVRQSFPVYRSRDWLSTALPFTLIGGGSVINTNADIIMLGWFTDSRDVGVYRVAMQGSMLVAFSLQVANSVVAPRFSALYARGEIARLQRLVTQSARVILLGALPVALIFIIAGGALMSWVFGPEFAVAHGPLAVLSIGYLISAGFGSVGFLLNMTGHERTAARILWQTALLNILTNALLIPVWGVMGAAFATALSIVIWNALLYRQVRARLGISSTAFSKDWA